MSAKLPASAFPNRATGEPIVFDRGVLFGKHQDDPFLGTPDETVVPDSGDAADLWVIDPSEFDERRHVIVAHERTTRREQFKRWLEYEAVLPHDDQPELVVYVPEHAPGSNSVARSLGAYLDAEIVSYYPPFVW